MVGSPNRVLRFLNACALLCCLGGLFPQRGSAQLPPNFQSEIFVGSGLIFPTSMEFLPDGSMLITEFSGKIWMVPPGSSEINVTPVLQLVNTFKDPVNLGGERGLTGITADPNFNVNHYIYVFYTAQTPQRDRVSRFTMNGATADLSSELVVWQAVLDSTTTDHHGGWLTFGPDGKLYISTGDNADSPSVQLLTSDHGKILRVNSDGTVPTDNPFYDGAGPNIDAIWARGLRNPYRFSFDSLTGRMYIGDVGQNNIEEVNIGVAGANYGWPTCEGPCNVSGFTNPIYSYLHNGRDSAITGGLVYRGTQFPAAYQGVYFFADYAQKWIQYLTLDSNGQSTGVNYFAPTDGSSDGPFGNPVCFRMGPDGALYYVDIGVSFTGVINPPAIRRIRYIAANQPPVVASSATPVSGVPPLTVSFSGAGSSDPENQPLTYFWTFGDGGTSTQASPTHTYQIAGPYEARLSVSDGSNTTLGTPILIQVGRVPLPLIASPLTGTTFRAGDVINFTGSATDPDDGQLPASAFSWTVLFHHESHIHPAAGPIPGTVTGSFVIPGSGHDFSGNTSYEIILTVTDSTGLKTTTSVYIYPEKVNVNFSSVPSGLTVNIDGIPYTTPFVKDALVNFQYTLQAPSQDFGTLRYGFISWSDGGAQSHTYTVPSATQNLSATFQSIGTSGLLAAWALDETAGSTATDGTGTNHAGTLVGNPTHTPSGRYAGGLLLNGTSDYMRVDSPGLPTSDFTWMMWLNRVSSTSFQGLLEAQGISGSELEIDLENNKVLVYSKDALRLTSNATLPVGTWVHLALVRSAGVYTLYLNGVADGATGTDPNTLNFTTCPLLVGVDADTGCTGALNGYFNGTLDEVRIYSRALSGTEVQSVMSVPVGTPVGDSIPPVRSNLLPSGPLPMGTTQTTLSLITDESATCRYATSAGVAYASMANAFTTSGSTAHSTLLTNLVNGGSYTYYVRCQDTSGNANPDDAVISFNVSTSQTPPGLLAAYNFNEGTGTTLNDVSGNGRNGVITGATWSTSGKFGNALSFNGTSNYVTIADAPALRLTTGMTLEAWVFPTNAAGTRDILIKEGPGADYYNLYSRNWRGRPESNVLVSGVNQTAEGTALTANVWTHLAGTYDGAALRLYVNGVQVATVNAPGSISTSTGALRIGGNTLWGEYFQGRIDDIRIYNRALSLTEIQTDMNTAVGGSAPADTTPPVRSNGAPSGALVAGTTQATLSLATDENATCRYSTAAGVAYASMANTFTTTGTLAHSTMVTGLTNGGSYNYYVRCQDTATNPNTTDFAISFTVATSQTPAGLVAAYSFNEGAGTTLTDVSGNGRNGVINGATWNNSGKFGKALAFNGTSNYVTIADAPALRLTTGMTLEAWVFPTSATGTRDVLIKEGPGADYYNLYSRNWRGRPESNVLVSGVNQTAEGTALAANVWTHLTGTYDGSVLRLYVNGVQVATTNAAGSISTSTGALRIGGNTLWGEYFQGRIDEIRIYNRVLSVTEIQADMNTAILP